MLTLCQSLGGQVLQAYLPMTPLLIVQVVGIVLGGMAASKPDRHRPGLLLLIGMSLLTLVLIARPILQITLMRMNLGGATFGSRMTILSIFTLALDTVGMGLLIGAALVWRGAAAPPARAATGATLPTNVPPAPVMPPLSLGLRLGLMYTPAVLGVMAMIAAVVVGQHRRDEGFAFMLLGLGVLLGMVSVIAALATIHALWTTIQPPPRGAGVEGIARTTPARAVGFLFIPIFSLYWVFQVWVGLARDMNRTLDMRGVDVPRVSPGLAIAICTIALVSIIPYVGVVTGLVNLVLLPIFLAGAFRAANALRALGGTSG